MAETTITYDHFGNMTQGGGFSYQFDPFNNVMEVDGGGTIQETSIYDASDERVVVCGRGASTSCTWTLRGVQNEVLREYESAPITSTNLYYLWKEDHVYRGALLAGAEREAADGGRLFFHLDHLGSPRLITNQDGHLIEQNEFAPFGRELASVTQAGQLGYGTETHRFTGHERDFVEGVSDTANYVDYMHARTYTPVFGRFLSVDEYLGSAPAPQSWNRYAYVLNNPLRYVDPFGLSCTTTDENGKTWTTDDCISVFAKDPGPFRILPQARGWLGGISPYQFATRDEAARAAIQDICGKSIKEDREYGGMIFESHGRYGFSSPIQGTAHEVSNAFGKAGNLWWAQRRMGMLPPPGGRMAGTYHTHGADSTMHVDGPHYDTQDEAISQHDVESARSLNLPSYVGTPTGRVLLYDPVPGRTQYMHSPWYAFDFDIGSVPCH